MLPIVIAGMNNSINKLYRGKSLLRKMGWGNVIYISLYYTFLPLVDSTRNIGMPNSKTVKSGFVFSNFSGLKSKYIKQGFLLP